MFARVTHPLLKVMLQHRNASKREIAHEPRRRDSTPCPASRSDSIACAPQRVSEVVDMSAQAEQPTLVDLSLVLLIFLKGVPLDLRNKLQSHTDDVQRGSYDERSLREMLAVA